MPLSKRSLRAFALLVVVFLIAKNSGSRGEQVLRTIKIAKPVVIVPTLYETLQLAELGLKETIFDKALEGWRRLKDQQSLAKPNILSIVDFSQSSTSKRFYIMDIEKQTVLFHTYVSHGRNSGKEFATSFANKPQSFKSSLGFYLTTSVYKGKGDQGLSLRLKGLEKDINHHAEQRGIVIHGASYVSESFIKKCGRLGRSQGCPAVPDRVCKPIIDNIKEGSCLFIFYPDSNYFKRSEFYN
jgi:hypothetical protein